MARLALRWAITTVMTLKVSYNQNQLTLWGSVPVPHDIRQKYSIEPMIGACTAVWVGIKRSAAWAATRPHSSEGILLHDHTSR